MPRKPTFEALKQVYKVLTTEPKPLSQIAEEAGVSWEFARKAINLLVELGLVECSCNGFKLKQEVTEE